LRKHVGDGGKKLGVREIFYYSCVANSDRDDEAADTADVFLVASRGSNDAGGPQVERGERAVEMDEVFDPGSLCAGNTATTVGDEEGCDHAPADRFAVKQDFVARNLLDGVPDRVAEIENHAQAVFALVLVDDRGFHADRRGDHFFKRFRVACEDIVSVLLHEAEERAVADDSGLDALHQACAKFAVGEGAEDVDVGKDGSGMMEAADEVFAFGKIDAGLSTDGGVDLGEEGCRDLYVANSTHEDSSDESADVADDAAAECDED